jgi:predicted DNA-binding transcriptional regulator AlpA
VPDRLMTPDEVANYLGTTRASLAQQRYRGKGPRFVKINGQKVRYRWSDIEAFLDGQTFVQTGGVR